MSKLISKRSWVGLEGTVKRGEVVEVNCNLRCKELISSGRAVLFSENKSIEVKETKGGPQANNSDNKDIEIKELKPSETKKRKRRTKAEIKADKAE